MSSTTTSSVTLNTGVQMPLLGLGTYKMHGSEEVYRAVDAALAAGYRAFDSAAVYRNEADLGRSLRELLPKHGLTRQDVFITSKLGPKDQGERAMEGALHSLSQLDLGYIDLYLIHWPGTQGLAVADQSNPGRLHIFFSCVGCFEGYIFHCCTNCTKTIQAVFSHSSTAT